MLEDDEINICPIHDVEECEMCGCHECIDDEYEEATKSK